MLDSGAADSATRVKAFYRRSLAQEDDDKKEADLKAALDLDPKNAAAKRDLAALRAKGAAFREEQKKKYSKMFG